MEENQYIHAINLLVEIQRETLRELRELRLSLSDQKKDFNVEYDLIDSCDVKSLLKISERTLARIKKNKLLTAVRIGKRDYYNREEIKRIAGNFMK